MTPSPATGRAPTTVADLLRLLKADPGRPRLTWYGPGGERIELSGHVLDNWVSKTANLLVEEYDAGPGTRVLLDLPPHWRTTVWGLASWRVGATVVLTEGPGTRAEADVVVSDHPELHQGDHDAVLALTLAALARRFDGTLPAGATDATAAVMTYGDVLGWAPPVVADEAALLAPGERVPHGEILDWAQRRARSLVARGPGPAAPRRALLLPSGADTAAVLAAVLALWADDGSAVLCAPDVARELAADDVRRERLVSTERITP